VNEDELKLLTTYKNKNYFMDIYVVKKDISISDIRLQPDETVDVKWATPLEIQQLIDKGEFVYSVRVRFKMYKDMNE